MRETRWRDTGSPQLSLGREQVCASALPFIQSQGGQGLKCRKSALHQNGVYAVWHLPADARVKIAADKLRLNFGIHSVCPSGMSVRQRRK